MNTGKTLFAQLIYFRDTSAVAVTDENRLTLLSHKPVSESKVSFSISHTVIETYLLLGHGAKTFLFAPCLNITIQKLVVYAQLCK